LQLEPAPFLPGDFDVPLDLGLGFLVNNRSDVRPRKNRIADDQRPRRFDKTLCEVRDRRAVLALGSTNCSR
jgi:hypothetical protein